MPHPPQVLIIVEKEDLLFYTTLFQSGVEIPSIQGRTISDFVTSLPGFTRKYIEDTVQTIFLDGMPVDDVDEKTFNKKSHTLALSAVMPGLVGAILRRNSLHASLRTETIDKTIAEVGEPTSVRLKIFNTIAQERGPLLFEGGVTFPAVKLYKSFSIRQSLLKKAKSITCNGYDTTLDQLFETFQEHSKITLTVRPIDEN